MSLISLLEQVYIYGMGMMGTSIGYALKKNPNFKGEIIGIVRSEESKKWLLQEGLANKVFLDTDEKLKIFCDIKKNSLLIIGLPVIKTISLLETIANYKLNILVTDLSSTRWEIENKVRFLEKHSYFQFVGAHPICGSELSGPKGYVPDLYKNKLCILIDRLYESSDFDRDPESFKKIQQFWEELEMKIYVMDASSHDMILAYLSHNPHIVSSLITTIIGQKPEIIKKNYESPVPLFGGGLRDMIRIAGSNPQMWYEIIMTNKNNIINSLIHFHKELGKFINNLKDMDEEEFKEFWFSWQDNAKLKRDQLYGNF